MRNVVLFALALFLVASTRPAEGQWVPVAQKKGFGQALGATPNAVFVGDPANTYTPGRVYVYARGDDDSWSETTYLEAEDGALDDRFGASVDVVEETLIVGAPSANAVYLFRQTAKGRWDQVGRVTASDSTSAFGTTVEGAGDRLFVSAAVPRDSSDGSGGMEESEMTDRRVVFVFSRQSDGDWTETAVLQNDDIGLDGEFGATLLATDKELVIGAPQHEGGVVTVYREGSSGWQKVQTVAPDGLGENAQFGTALFAMGDRILVGAPGAMGTTGVVQVLSSDGDSWTSSDRLYPFDGTSGHYFGAALATRANELWVGAPGADDETGTVYRYRHEDGAWIGGLRVESPEPNQGDSFGSTLARSGSTIAGGLPGDNYGAGTMALYSTTADAWTADSPVAPSTGEVFSAITGEEKRCSEGEIEGFSCDNVDLKSFLPIDDIGGTGGVELNDIWGWTDPETGTEYALVGRADGTSFVDVSDPTNPVYVGELPMTEGSRANSWRDVKVYEDHAFIVADNVGDHGMQVFDLTRLGEVDAGEMPVTFDADALYEPIDSAHNVVINKDTGFAYLVGGSGGGKSCGGGLHMVNIQDPLNPTFEGCFGGERGAGSGGTGATHDAQCILYDGPDQEYRGREICVAYNETEIAVVDVTDKSEPTLVSTATYPNFGYVHQGWFTEDRRYMYSNDEGDELQGKTEQTRTIVWNVEDLDHPTVANELLLSTTSSDHNLYVKGDRMYQSNYKSGLRVFDISDPVQPKEIGHFDLFPPSSTPGFEGTWSNYPYFESGIVVTSSFGGGLFVLQMSQPEL